MGGREKAGMVISLGDKHKENGFKETGFFPIQGEQQRDPDKRKPALPWLVWLSGWSAGLQTKGRRFDSQSWHMPGLWAGSPVGGCARGNHTVMFLSLPSLCLKINK